MFQTPPYDPAVLLVAGIYFALGIVCLHIFLCAAVYAVFYAVRLHLYQRSESKHVGPERGIS